MAWPDQTPPATDIILHLNVPCSGGGSPAYLEIDKLADGRYRATVGTLFEFQEGSVFKGYAFLVSGPSDGGVQARAG